MRVYRVRHNDVGIRFVGSEAEARTTRVQMFENAPRGVKRSDIDIQMVDIPTTKPELLAWLNHNFGA